MSKTIGVKQGIQGLLTLGTKVNWDEVDGDDFQRMMEDKDEQLGPQFTLFLKNGGNVIVGEPRIVKIDRSKPFDPAKFIGDGWTIWKGPANGDGLTGAEDQDIRALAITELDLSKIQFRDMLKSGESYVSGEEKQKRLAKAGYVRLDARIFQTFWENQVIIPAVLKEPISGNTRYTYFDGTVLRSPCGDRCMLYLYWNDSRWGWNCDCLGHGWNADNPSAVLGK
jgi:hypothetical protein